MATLLLALCAADLPPHMRFLLWQFYLKIQQHLLLYFPVTEGSVGSFHSPTPSGRLNS